MIMTSLRFREASDLQIKVRALLGLGLGLEVLWVTVRVRFRSVTSLISVYMGDIP